MFISFAFIYNKVINQIIANNYIENK